MANVGIGDHCVIYNILCQLPGKSLLRFRCVSKHWKSLISDPYFMKSRSRRMVLLAFTRPFVVTDDKGDNIHSVFRMSPAFQPMREQLYTSVSVVGTFNGVVLLALYCFLWSGCHLVLFNPLTSASKKVVAMGPPCQQRYGYVFGFGYGYGETTDNLKIVRIEVFGPSNREVFKYDVFDLKTSSWSMSPQYLTKDFHFSSDMVGRFLNGILYWTISVSCFRMLALNVKEMVFSKMKLPYELQNTWPLLGSMDGCLCLINRIDHSFRFDLWVSKDHGGGVEISWLKARSFTIRLEGHSIDNSSPFYILGNGKILITGIPMQLVMYDMFKDSYKAIDLKSSLCQRYVLSDLRLPIEYVESLVSPDDMC